MPALDELKIASGKVREIYDLGDERLLLVASDRLSAFDVILPTPIPDKGRVLTAMTLFWLEELRDVVPNHLITAAPAEFPAVAHDVELYGRSMVVKRLEMLPVEAVVRGYVAGSGWKDYQATGTISGHELPQGLREADQLPQPIFTPATKAAVGDHDENITREQTADLLGRELFDRLEHAALTLYARASQHARTRGIIIADTKFEFGLDERGELVLGDEVLTPDSSRFWPVDQYAPGQSPPSFDKQYVRDYLETLDWDKTAPGPELPREIAEGTAARYRDAYQRLTGRDFEGFLQEMGVR